MLGRTTDATYLLPQTVKVQIPRQHGPDVVGEPERVQQRQQRQQTDVHRVREPGLDRDGVVREAAVRARRVVDDEYSVQVATYRRQVLGVRAKVGRTVLPVVAPLQDVPPVVQLIGDCGAVNLHAGGEHDQVVPLGHNIQEVVDVGPLVHEEPHRVPVDRDLDGEVVRRAGLDRVAGHRVVVRVDQRLVQVQHQRLALDHPEPVAGHGRQREQFIFHRLMLYKLMSVRLS